MPALLEARVLQLRELERPGGDEDVVGREAGTLGRHRLPQDGIAPVVAVAEHQLVEVEVELHGDLTDEQRKRLLDIANRCPVHRTLTSEIDIRSRLVDAR